MVEKNQSPWYTVVWPFRGSTASTAAEPVAGDANLAHPLMRDDLPAAWRICRATVSHIWPGPCLG